MQTQRLRALSCSLARSIAGDSVGLCGRRLSTAGLLAVLGMLYPRSYMLFLSLMFLDIFSHWCACRPAAALRSPSPAGSGAMRYVCARMAIRGNLPLQFNAITIRAGFRCTPRLFRAAKPTRCGRMLTATQHCRQAGYSLHPRTMAVARICRFTSLAGGHLLVAGREQPELAGAHVLPQPYVHGHLLYLV